MLQDRLVLRMRRSLAEPVPEPVWPAGVTLVPFDPEHHPRPFHALLERGYEKGGGSVQPFAIWWRNLREDTEYDPALCLVAVNREGTMVGAMQGWTSAFIKDIAVAPEWRRKGLGSALLHATFRLFRERGAEAVELKVDSDNPTGAVHFYRAQGMIEIERYPLV